MKARWKFSLIELLVVVAIIAILISLLLPALRQAKGVAKRSLCQSNLKNFSVAHSHYITDGNGCAVPHTRKYEWEDLLAVYLGKPKYDGYAQPINFPNDNIFICPEQPGGRGYYPSYAINATMANDIRLIVKYRRPSTKFFMVDAWKSDYFRWSFFPGQYVSTGNVSIRHVAKTCNIAFIDGHVKGYGCPPIPKASLGLSEDRKWTTPGYPAPDGL